MLRSKHYTRTEPDTEPVSVDELRKQLRLDTTEHDNELMELIEAARREAEELHLNAGLMTQTCIDYFDGFGAQMELKWPPVASITSITYTDTNGDTQTLSTDTYELGTVNGMGVVRLKYGQTYPSTRSHEDVVTVTYVAGYGSLASDVPLNTRQWIKLYAAWLFENREGALEPLPSHVMNLLGAEATGRVIG